jgi:hypothetical protein
MSGNLTTYSVPDDSWTSFENSDWFLDYINPLNGQEIDKLSSVVQMKKLPFYKNVEILRVNLDKWAEPEETSFFYFAKVKEPYENLRDKFIELRGLSEDIYEINELGGLELNKETYLEYLKFFCYFLIDDEKQTNFFVIEDKYSEFLELFSDYEKDRILQDYPGANFELKTDTGVVEAYSRVMFGEEVFDAIFEIHADGTVVMTNDERIAAIS